MLANRAPAKADLYDMEFPQISPLAERASYLSIGSVSATQSIYLWIYIFISLDIYLCGTKKAGDQRPTIRSRETQIK
jgi:hypothetical protein